MISWVICSPSRSQAGCPARGPAVRGTRRASRPVAGRRVRGSRPARSNRSKNSLSVPRGSSRSRSWRAPRAYAQRTAKASVSSHRAALNCSSVRPSPCSRPATRPSGPCTGRRGANRLSSSSGDRGDTSAAAAGRGSVRARVWVEKSSSRTLIPIRRPRRDCAVSARHSRSISSSRIALERLELGDVVVERRLRGTRRSPCAPRSPGVVLEPRPSLQLGGRIRGPKRAPSRTPVARPRAPQRLRAATLEPLGRLRPDPRNEPA